MPVDPRLVRDTSLLPDGERLAWAARLRAAAEEVDAVERSLRRSAGDAGLVGPAGDALADLAGVLAGDVSLCARAVQGAATTLLAVGSVTGSGR